MAESRSKSNSPLAQDRQRKKKIFVYVCTALLAILAVGLITSYIYKTSRGEKWEPLAFLFGTKAAPTLPVSPTFNPEILTTVPTTKAPATEPTATLREKVTTAAKTDAPTSEETVPEVTETETAPETTEEPTTEEPTTEEPTTEEPTTEEPTTEEPTTEEPTTEEPTTEPPTEPATTAEPTTEAPAPFDDASLSAHLEAAGLSEDALLGTQLIVVRGLDDSRAMISFFEKTEAGWAQTSAVPTASGMLGADGIVGEKLPGDAATPAGYFAIGPAYGTAPSAITALEYHQLLSGDVWVSDPASSFYNSLQNNHDSDADWTQSIELLTQNEIYKYALLIRYNLPEPDPALGNAIFLNMNTAAPTDGSVGIKEVTLFTLFQWLRTEADPHVLIYQTP